MSLTDDLARERAGRSTGTRCSVAVLCDTLPADELGELRAAFADTTMPSTVIADVLTRRGHAIGDQVVAQHRRQGRSGGCRCETL